MHVEHTCSMLIQNPHTRWYGEPCDRPARHKWHAQDDEWFCDIHKDGIPDEFESEEQYNLFWSTVREGNSHDH